MDNCLSVIVAGDSAEQRVKFLHVVDAVCGYADEETAQFRGGRVDDFHAGTLLWASAQRAALVRTIEERMALEPGSESVWSARVGTHAWRMANVIAFEPLVRDAVPEFRGRVKESRREDIDVDYHGIRARCRNGYTPRYERGDICVCSPSYVLGPGMWPQDNSIGDRSPTRDVNDGGDNARAEQLVVAVIRASAARSGLLVPAIVSGSGPLYAWYVFHRDPREFVWDIGRSLLLMANALGMAASPPVPRVGEPPEFPLAYFDNGLWMKDSLCDLARLSEAKRNCIGLRRELEVKGNPGLRPLVAALELLESVDVPALGSVLRAMSASRVVSVLQRSKSVKCMEVGDGWLVLQEPVIRVDGHASEGEGVYHDLLRAAMNDELVE